MILKSKSIILTITYVSLVTSSNMIFEEENKHKYKKLMKILPEVFIEMESIFSISFIGHQIFGHRIIRVLKFKLINTI